jgi:large subunit ribosomal protein L5
MAVSLKEKFEKEVKSELKENLSLKNVHEIPCVQKVTINLGLGAAAANAKTLENAIRDLTLIAGQKPVITRAKKSIAGFKLRENMPIGLKVTLRSEKMYNFLSKLINIAMPRIRDFQGISRKAFDGRGNYTLGLKEQIIFPEIKYDQVDAIRGMDVTVCTSAKDNESALVLLEMLGFPFKKDPKKKEAVAV